MFDSFARCVADMLSVGFRDSGRGGPIGATGLREDGLQNGL